MTSLIQLQKSKLGANSQSWFKFYNRLFVKALGKAYFQEMVKV